MAGYCTSVRPYFYEPQASENTAQYNLSVSGVEYPVYSLRLTNLESNLIGFFAFLIC